MIQSNLNFPSIDIKSISPHIGKKITKIPQYVFENCNQVTCNDYQPRYLELLREKSKVIKFCDDIKQAEEYDWIYGLDTLETEMLPLSSDKLIDFLTFDQIFRCNRLFSRLNGTGEIRERLIRWSHKDISNEEAVVISILEQYLSQNASKTDSWFSELSKPQTKSENISVKVSWLTNQIRYFQNNPHLIQLGSQSSWKDVSTIQNFDLKLVEKWANNKKHLDICRWIKERFHYFPDAKEIKPELAKAIEYIKSHPDMHPIEKGAYLWYELVRIHISHEANKRTGKALASIIFLAHGYLPPKIPKEDAEEYVKLLQKGFARSDGHIAFTQFVARKILDTQKEYAALKVD